MVTGLFELEVQCLNSMTRSQLMEAIGEHWDCLPVDLQERIGEQATDSLRLHVLAARLIHALRQRPSRRVGNSSIGEPRALATGGNVKSKE